VCCNVTDGMMLCSSKIPSGAQKNRFENDACFNQDDVKTRIYFVCFLAKQHTAFKEKIQFMAFLLQKVMQNYWLGEVGKSSDC